jgi:hypothetical protein
MNSAVLICHHKTVMAFILSDVKLPAFVGLALVVTGSLFIRAFRWFPAPPPDALVSASTTLLETGESSFLHASPDNCYENNNISQHNFSYKYLYINAHPSLSTQQK